MAKSLILALMSLLLFACQTIPDRPAGLVIEDVTVIDPLSRRVLPNSWVYVDGDRIVAIERGSPSRRFAPARQVDGTGRFLVPGLMDMHVHLFLPEPATPTLNLLLANGVTSIREMSSDCWAAAGARKGCVGDYRQLQERLRSGATPGPDLVGLTSTMVMGPTRLKLPPAAPKFITPVTEADARTLVRHLAARNVDLIKTHDSIPSQAFRAVMDEANRLGMRVGGHVPFRAGSLGAAQAGYDSIEHARDLLYDCSRYGPEFRDQEADFAEGKPGAVRPSNVVRLSRTVTEFDAAACQRTLSGLARLGTYYVPTHVTREMEARAGEPGFTNDPARRYIMRDRNARWEADLKETAALPVDERKALAAFFEHGLRITGLAHRAGIPVMAGTDASDTMIVPGFSLHRELALLRRAGLSNMDVLRSATTVPAAWLGRRDLGGIAAGMEADLVLLRGNPLEDVAHASSIEAVIANGRLFTRPELDVLLLEAERIAATPRP